MSAFVAMAVAMVLATLALLTRPLWWRWGAHRGAASTAVARPAAMIAALAGLVLVVAGGGYAWLGTPQASDPERRVAQAPVPNGATSEATDGATDGSTKGATNGTANGITPAKIETMTQLLVARLKDEPGNVDGWVMLGRAYVVLGRHDQAVPAFQQALALRGDDAALIADYAEALWVAGGRRLEGGPSSLSPRSPLSPLLARALEIDPGNLKALSLAGTVAFLRKEYPLALRHWEKLVRVAPPEAPFVQKIQLAIDEARRQAGNGPGVGVGNASVSGVVTLSSALASKAAPDDTLFVFARAVQGSPMPLAILRKQVKDLPLTFTLDDSMAMSPAARLSSAQQVVVAVRISKSGQALAQPGDLQGQSAPVAPGESGLRIEIGQIVAR